MVGILGFSDRPGFAQAAYQHVPFSDLSGWNADDHAAALEVFLNTCGDMRRADWLTLCELAKDVESPKEFFEVFFQPVQITFGDAALFTGYFEPELNGSLTLTEQFSHPVYKEPKEAKEQNPWLTRREILTTDVMKNRGLEIAWVDDPVALYFLQIQGSGRIRLPDGSTIRVGYGGGNGQPYRSVGRKLIEDGTFEAHQVSAQVIKNWVNENGQAGQDLLMHNPSYVFFRQIKDLPSEKGPLGAMNRSITPMRSIAIDPRYTKLGAPVWIEKGGEKPLQRLMIAQDTGGAIKGPQRADIFFGTGDKMGRAAGRIKDGGRMVVLLPIQHAYALLPEHLQ